MEIQLLTKILMLAFLGEALTKTVKDIWQSITGIKDHKELVTLLINIFIGVGLAVQFDVDATVVLNGKIDIIGCVLTGFIGSRGANFVNDLSKKMRPT